MSGAKASMEIRARVAGVSEPTLAALRPLRREISRQLRDEPPLFVIDVVLRLVSANDVPVWFPYELLTHHKRAMGALELSHVEQLAEGLSSWGHVDTFACCVAGPAWREGRIDTKDIEAWSASPDRWWRRAALVSTVALNNTARGGHGDARRTLGICELLKHDRDDMVVKAMSWALRELAKKEPDIVQAYIAENERVLAPRVLREVRSKLQTGLKTPKPRR